MKKRVTIPTSNPTALLDLARKVQSKHTADGDASPLKMLKWSEITPKVEAAIASHEKAQQLKREMLEAFQQRDLNLDDIKDALRNSRDILSGTYKKEMKVLGQWGYEVLDVRSTSATAKPADASVKA